MKEMNFDAVIIGGGVTGCAIARELSRYDLHTCVVEREEDVCSGTSKANSAIVHAGHDAAPGSAKAKFNVEGNRLMGQLAEDLDFEFKRNGSLILCFAEEDMPSLQELYNKGIKNGSSGFKDYYRRRGQSHGAKSDGYSSCRFVCADRRHCMPVRLNDCAG